MAPTIFRAHCLHKRDVIEIAFPGCIFASKFIRLGYLVPSVDMNGLSRAP